MKSWLPIVGLVIFGLWFWYSRSTPKIQSALNLEERGEYAAAYQEYATLLVKAAQKFEPPKAEGDIKEWMASLIRNYTSFKSDQPKKSDCTAAYSKLRTLQVQLDYLEHTFQPKESVRLEKSGMLQFWKERWYESQKSMPESATRNAEMAFANHITVVWLKGDFSSHVEGTFYSPDLDLSIPFLLEHGTFAGFVALLQPGEWVIVSRVVPELSEPRDEIYRQARRVIGRYAATFIRIPNESSALELQLVLHDQVD